MARAHRIVATVGFAVVVFGTAAACSRGHDGAAIGVPECDAYVVRYQACIESMAPSLREGELTALHAQADSLRRAASTEKGKAGLGRACARMSDALGARGACK